ncbi:hypothetical protein FIBSPDRAFT_886074 [Athelia psychrophila]|uniref:Uncharacterized protein n=1 Tax=Athelia psychrophila TaxID=1759441 RepID=A0A166R2T8_9AGAM|nr:hypothetical protein FIBSPDRAFT_886074 [Fibularhizoctonia sp. CBS 109695]
MELDRKAHEFPLREDATKTAISQAPKTIEGMRPGEAVTLCVMSHAREVVLLYMHRSFFAQAPVEYPTNPLTSPYGPSFLAPFRAGTATLRTIRGTSTCAPRYVDARLQRSGGARDRRHKGPGKSASKQRDEGAETAVSVLKGGGSRSTTAKALPVVMTLAGKAQAALKAEGMKAFVSPQSRQGRIFHSHFPRAMEKCKLNAEDPEDALANWPRV